MPRVRYLRLNDYDNRGTIVKQEGTKAYLNKNGEWIRTGILFPYFYPDAPEYDCYDEITEEEAMREIKKMVPGV